MQAGEDTADQGEKDRKREADRDTETERESERERELKCGVVMQGSHTVTQHSV